MPVDSTHPTYSAFLPKWKRCLDTYDGEDAVKAAGVDYLPSLGQIDTPEDEAFYQRYKTRASFLNAMKPTIKGIVGLIMLKDPTQKGVDEALWEALDDDMTLTGVSFREWTRETITELLKAGRVAALVDWSEEKQRPYATFYNTTQLINWGPGWFVLSEEYHAPKADDPFTIECRTRYRQLSLVEGVYTVTIWQKEEGKETFSVVSQIIPTFRKKPLNFIPLAVMSATGETTPTEPPFLDLVNVNLSHYRNGADLEHGLHYTALPTPWATGVDPKKVGSLHVGSGTAWMIANDQARVGMLEFQGTGLSSIRETMASKEKHMAYLGAMKLLETPKDAEAAQTARIHAGKDTASLQDVCLSAESFLETVLSYLSFWTNGKLAEPEVKVNREFVNVKMDPEELTALTDALIKGAISYETYFFNLQKGMVVAPDRTVEEETDALTNQNLPLGPPPGQTTPPELASPAGELPPGGQGGEGEGGGTSPGEGASS